tara:strand:- start:12249 stop:12740 length:492 start_codon:yes stop_codon:yes gene_type:complete
MKNLFILLFTLFTFSTFAQVGVKDHNLILSLETYYENVQYQGDSGDIFKHQGGMEFNVKFEFKNPKLQFIGADFGVGFNTYEDFFKLHLGVAFRKKLFKDFVEASLIIPRLSAPLDGIKGTGYNTPWGWSLEFLKSPVKLKLTQYFYKNASLSRVGIVYRFNN